MGTVSEEGLGTGLSGTVRECRGNFDDQTFALKVLRKSEERRGGSSANNDFLLRKECEIYLALDHPNIAKLKDVYEDGELLYIVMELCRGGELYARLRDAKVYDESTAAKTVKQMLHAVSYLHTHGIVHRDLKLENFLYTSTDKSSVLKLVDFGFAAAWNPRSEKMRMACGTMTYVPPEVLFAKTRGGYTNKCDMWSLGVIAFMLVAGDPPFYGKGDKETKEQIAKAEPVWLEDRWNNVSASARDFVTKSAPNPTRTYVRYHSLGQRAFQDDYTVSEEELGTGLSGTVRVCRGNFDDQTF